MRLVRNNVEDPRVASDLEFLASEFGDERARELAAESVAAADRAATGTVDEPAELARGVDGAASSTAISLEDPFVRRFVGVAVHVKRYAPYYVGALLWLGTILFVQPVGRDSGGDAQDQGFAAAPGASSVGADDAGLVAPTEPDGANFTDIGGAPSSFDLAGPLSNNAFEPFSGSSGPAFDETPPKFDDTIFSDSDEDEGPQPLTIVASGYSSRTGGTPLERPPAQNGLPVAGAGTQDVKRSYIKLAGDEMVLRMRLIKDESQDGNVNASAAQVRICPITKADWKPARGESLDAGPTFDANLCQAGVPKAEGLWEFDLEIFGAPPSTLPGFALTKGAGATGNTFQVVFAPVAVTTKT